MRHFTLSLSVTVCMLLVGPYGALLHFLHASTNQHAIKFFCVVYGSSNVQVNIAHSSAEIKYRY